MRCARSPLVTSGKEQNDIQTIDLFNALGFTRHFWVSQRFFDKMNHNKDLDNTIFFLLENDDNDEGEEEETDDPTVPSNATEATEEPDDGPGESGDGSGEGPTTMPANMTTPANVTTPTMAPTDDDEDEDDDESDEDSDDSDSDSDSGSDSDDDWEPSLGVSTIRHTEMNDDWPLT